MKNIILKLLPLADLVLSPLVYPAALLLKLIRMIGIHRVPLCRGVLLNVGVFPLRNHYYEPQFDNRNPKVDFFEDRNLPGIKWNESVQLEFLDKLVYEGELKGIPREKERQFGYYLNNYGFKSGEAEYWYQLLRAVKPKKIIEIGSGFSTLIARRALLKNVEDEPDYRCDHVCIEPYEMPWLEGLGVSVVRSKVEDVSLDFFTQLGENDILFIDSSHVIRPQGDILFEYLEILPTLNRGVIVHIHDIFSPKNYLKQWLQEEVRFWNEQYLVEAFLTENSNWIILGALNFLRHRHFEKLQRVAPYLTPDREPSSLYIQKIG